MYDIIGYHKILYVRSCMTLLVIIYIICLFMYEIIDYHNIYLIFLVYILSTFHVFLESD